MPRPDKKPVKEPKQASPKTKKESKKAAVEEVKTDPVVEVVPEIAVQTEPIIEEQASVAIESKSTAEHKTYPALEEKPDFRGLADPEKTLRRVAWISHNEYLTHGEKSTAIAFLLLFEGQPDRTQITISAHLNKSTGYSPQVVRTVLDILTDWGLMKREIIKKKGTDVTLLF